MSEEQTIDAQRDQIADLQAEVDCLKHDKTQLTAERDRLRPCRGCPTVECTCLSELEDDLLDKCNALREQVRGLSEALEKIDDEPNQIGPEADEMVENYGVKAWSIAHSALAKYGAKKET